MSLKFKAEAFQLPEGGSTLGVTLPAALEEGIRALVEHVRNGGHSLAERKPMSAHQVVVELR